MGRNQHNHAAPVEAMIATKIKCLLKKEASKDVFKPASEVVNDILLNELTDAPCPSLPNLDSLQRTANRVREQLRPQDPKDLDFELETEHIPDGFFREDIKVSILVKQIIKLYIYILYSKEKIHKLHLFLVKSEVKCIALNYFFNAYNIVQKV